MRRNEESSVVLKVFVGLVAAMVLVLLVMAVVAISKLFKPETPISELGVQLEESVASIDEATPIRPVSTVDGVPLANDKSHPAGHIDPPEDSNGSLYGELLAPAVDTSYIGWHDTEGKPDSFSSIDVSTIEEYQKIINSNKNEPTEGSR